MLVHREVHIRLFILTYGGWITLTTRSSDLYGATAYMVDLVICWQQAKLCEWRLRRRKDRKMERKEEQMRTLVVEHSLLIPNKHYYAMYKHSTHNMVCSYCFEASGQLHDFFEILYIMMQCLQSFSTFNMCSN